MAMTVSITPTNYTTFNNRTPGRRGPPMGPSPITTEEIVSAVFFCILVILIVTGNSLVLGSFRVNRRLRTKTNYFIMSLAFADLAIGLMSVPSWNYLSLRKLASREFNKFYQGLDVVVGVASILNLTMISLERGYALMRPIRHRNIRKVTIILAIFTAWSLAVFAGSLRFMMSPAVASDTYGIIVTAVFFFVPLCIILVTYAIIFRIASAHARGRGVRSFKKDLRIATTVAVVIGFFTIAWTPFFSLNFFFCICRYYDVRLCKSVPQELIPVVKWMQYLNSACNPIIYGFRNKDFKIAFKKIIYKMCRKEVPVSRFTQSTYAGKTTKGRMMRSESSFDESVIYPDQIVPPGMYDMRESYRSAISRGCKTPSKTKPQKKGLAQGLMALSVETFNMASPDDVTGVTNQSLKSSDANHNTADTSQSKNNVHDSSEIDVYPIDEKTESRDQGVVNGAFTRSLDNVSEEKKSPPRFRVHFGDSNGLVNGGLVPDDNQEHEDVETTSQTLEIPSEKQRSNSDLTPLDSLQEGAEKNGMRRMSLT